MCNFRGHQLPLHGRQVASTRVARSDWLTYQDQDVAESPLQTPTLKGSQTLTGVSIVISSAVIELHGETRLSRPINRRHGDGNLCQGSQPAPGLYRMMIFGALRLF